MSDNTTDLTTQPADPAGEATQPTAPAPAAPAAPAPATDIFENIDTSLIDDGGFKASETAQFIRSAQEASAKKDKQILDLRRVISKGVGVPKSADEYAYTPSKDFEQYYTGEGVVQNFVKASMDKINTVAFEKAMTAEQASAVKDMFNDFMVSTQLFDNKSAEAQVAKAAYREQVLGPHADDILKELEKTFINHGAFDDNEKQALVKGIENDPVLAGAAQKLTQLAFGSRGSIPAREYTASGTLADDYTLASEYNNPATSDTRREEIIMQRLKAGRSSSLPLV